MDDLKQLITRLYTHVLHGEVEAARRYVTEVFIDHGQTPGKPSGIFSLAWLVGMDDNWMPSMGIKIEDMIAEGDRVAVRWLLHGVRVEHRPLGHMTHMVQARGITMYRVAQGRIAERWMALSV